MDDLKVSLPTPCSEPWENMTPSGCNRHCASCDKIIHDLSALTIDEAEDLLASGEEVCVRAKVGRGGVVELAGGRSTSQRRMIAAVGASLSLAAAACQTVPPENRLNRFEITGSVPWTYSFRKPIVRSSDGQTWQVKMEYRSRDFRVPDLYPGTYSLTYSGGCSQGLRQIDGIVIQDASVDVGQLEDVDDCIIVGVMVPLKPGSRGSRWQRG